VTILASCSPGEVRVAALDAASELLDYTPWRPARPDGVGDLHRGRVIARAPALAGAFVALVDAEGFLPDSEGGAEASEGDPIGVRVARAAQGGKGPRLTARLGAAEAALIGTGPPARLRAGPNAVLRLAALHPAAPVLVDDASVAATLRTDLGTRMRLVPRAFDDAIEAAVEALAEPDVPLPDGGRMSIHPTPALTAIDLDLGSGAGGRGAKRAQHEAANRAALPVLARQIRLRNLAGAILVDFAGLSPRRRAALGPELAAALQDDPLRPRLLGFTRLGLAEIVRTRVHPPLHELLAGAPAAGYAALRRVAATAAAQPWWQPSLAAAPAVADALLYDEDALADLRRRTGRAARIHKDATLAPLGWRVGE
jgi:Ribonuclease G/E